MLTIKVSQINKVYSSIEHDRVWGIVYSTVMQKINESDDGKVMLDFSGVSIKNPWRCDNFVKLVNDNRIYMKFIGAEDILGHIEVMSLMNPENTIENYKERFQNTPIKKEVKKSADERHLEEYSNRIIEDCHIYKTHGKEEIVCANYDLHKLALSGSIDDINSIRYLDKAIERLYKEKNVRRMNISVFYIKYISESAMVYIANMMKKYRGEVSITIEGEQGKNYAIDLKNHVASTNRDNLTDDKKIECIIENKKKPEVGEKIVVNIPGKLIKYVKSRAKDKLGRSGEGKPVWTRPAILESIQNTSEGYIAHITAYIGADKNTFNTREYYLAEEEGNVPAELPCVRLDLPLSDFGFEEYYFGTYYHFTHADQRSLSESRKVIVGFDENGYNVNKMCTVPERMKVIFDSWGIAYDKDVLQYEIERAAVQMEVERSKHN